MAEQNKGFAGLLGNVFGTAPPAYMEGLLGQQATEDLRKRSIGTGIANALIGYAGMPKNQNLGLGRILAGAAQAGIGGAQGVYKNATQDYVQGQAIEQAKAAQTARELEIQRTSARRQLSGNIMQNGAINQDSLQGLAALSDDPLALLNQAADLSPKLRRMNQTGAENNPFKMFAEGGQSPTVKKLAQQYSISFENGQIDLETAEKTIMQLGKMDDTYSNRLVSQEGSEQSRALSAASLANAMATLEIQKEAASRKQLPPQVYSKELEMVSSATGNIDVAGEVENVINQVYAADIDFSPALNLKYKTMAATGSRDPKALLWQEIERFKTKVTNDILRLNKGVQTDGDFKRAKQELSEATSKADLIKAFYKMQRINLKYAKDINKTLRSSRTSSGYTPESGYPQPSQVDVSEAYPHVFGNGDYTYTQLPSGSVYHDGNDGGKLKRKK